MSDTSSRDSYINQYGTSYRLASKFFTQAMQEKIYLLYAFVRRADNIVDNPDVDLDQTRQQLTELQQRFHHTHHGTLSDDNLTNEFVTLCRTHQIKPERVDAFYESMLLDTTKNRYQTVNELATYTYGSAEVIGLMICQLAHADKTVRPAAQQLGSTMQYTNFLRDIREDYIKLGRIYLPADQLAADDLTHEDIAAYCTGAPVNNKRKVFCRKRVGAYRQQYQQAKAAIDLLPSAIRQPVHIATALYEAILDKIEQHGYDVFSTSMHTTPQEKFTIVARITGQRWKKQLSWLLEISRPRFWIYLAGPVLLGWTATVTQPSGFLHRQFLVMLCYFLFPANLFLYGINDLYDYATDKHNPRKNDYEQLVTKEKHRFLQRAILLVNLPFLVLFYLSFPQRSLIPLTLFILLGWDYSSPPIRFKAVPFLDSMSNILYIMPGGMAYLVGGGTGITQAMIAAGLWAMAMHTYSAIPDIAVDKQAGVQTTAVLLGKNYTLVYCLVLWMLAAYFAYPVLGDLSWIAGGVYVWICLLSYQFSINRLYQRFPFVNTVVGASIFFTVSQHILFG